MDQPASTTESRGLWVYAVCQHVDDACLGSLPGLGSGAITAVTGSGLSAVAEDVSLADYGEQALRANLENMAWLEATARAHHAVIDAVARAGPVVPMRLATVYSGEAALRAMLRARAAEIRDVLGRIAARSEWGVKAFAVSAGAPAPDAGGGGQAGRAAGSGAAYLRRRRDELSAQHEGRRAAAAAAERVHDGLGRLAVAARLHPPQPPQLTGKSEPMLLNAAYLVDERDGAAIRQAVAGLTDACPALRLELTGPWPPYSFAEMREGTGDDR